MTQQTHKQTSPQAGSLSRRAVLSGGVGAWLTGSAASAQALAPRWNPTISTARREPRIENAKIKGLCQDRFEGVRKTLETSFAAGDDIGASVAVFIDGEPVVDLWGGYFDAAFDRPWERDTIITTHSITKTMTGIAALVLADRGELDLDAPVVKYWPEFARAGKSRVLVRHLICHMAGLPGWTDDVTWPDVFDLQKSTELLARQEPWWTPGTAAGYHGMTMGHLVSGVIERITGQTLGQFFAEHVARPLGADYQIGVGAKDDHRISCFVQAMPEDLPYNSPMLERVGLNPNLTPQTSHAIAWRRAEVGAANGHGNARSVATVHSALASGSANGRRLLSDKMRMRVLEPQASHDVVLGAPLTWGLGGFSLEAPIFDNKRGHRVAYWGGNGGSLGFVDFDERMSVSFVMNRWMEGPFETVRFNRILAAVYAGLERGR